MSQSEIELDVTDDERVRIKSNGYVGIGTDNPAMMVHLESANHYIRSKNTAAPSDEKTWVNAGTDGTS